MTAPMESREDLAEPMPGSAEAPFISDTAHREYHRALPRVYRVLDAQNDYALKRYLAAVFSALGDVDELIDRLRGYRPLGPSKPEPWDLDPDELARWREARRDVNSALTDPLLADTSWLPWLAQMVGARLDPSATETERRQTIQFATSGYRRGTRDGLADAARVTLTGSRYVAIQPMVKADGSAGTVWDITIRTRTSETPDPSLIIPTIVRLGAKPAGVRLWVASFGTSWDVVEAKLPTWTDWESRTWDQLEEIGATYSTPGNMAPGPSFETTADVAKWAPVAEGGGTVSGWALSSGTGIDGANSGRLTKVGAAGGMRVRSQVITDATNLLPDRDFVWGISLKPSVAMTAALIVNWQNSSGGSLGSTAVTLPVLTPGQWNRITSDHHSPVGAARATIDVQVQGTPAAGSTLDVDAALFRIRSTTGG